LGAIIPGWTPLHVQLRVLTRLSFNESGRVTYHRDFVDVKDLFSLVPGFTAVQWFSSTLAARLLSGVSSVLLHGPEIVTEDSSTDDDALYAVLTDRSGKRGGARSLNAEKQRAPDVDRG